MIKDPKLRIAVLIITALVLGILWFLIDWQMPTKQGNFQLGSTLLQVEVADTLATQYQGLSDRDSLCENCGMLFVYPEARLQRFVMRRMRFGLDFVFIREGQVIQIVENVPPPKPGEEPIYVNSSALADAVLEVNAGFLFKNKIKIGDSAVLDQTP